MSTAFAVLMVVLSVVLAANGVAAMIDGDTLAGFLSTVAAVMAFVLAAATMGFFQ